MTTEIKLHKVCVFAEDFITSVWRQACNEPNAHGCSMNVSDVWVALAVKHFGLSLPHHLIHPMQLLETNTHVYAMVPARLSYPTKVLLNDHQWVDTVFQGPHTTLIKFTRPDRHDA
jgi:hypothetical protein